MGVEWSVAISGSDPERMPEIASLHIGIIPFADSPPSLAMTKNMNLHHSFCRFPAFARNDKKKESTPSLLQIPRLCSQ